MRSFAEGQSRVDSLHGSRGPLLRLRHGFRYPEFPHDDLIKNKLNVDVAVRLEMTLERVGRLQSLFS